MEKKDHNPFLKIIECFLWSHKMFMVKKYHNNKWNEIKNSGNEKPKESSSVTNHLYNHQLCP